MKCGVCGGEKLSFRQVLWDQLIRDWQLSAEETAYINRQQGETCDRCGSNLRSIALANAIRAFLGTQACLRDIAAARKKPDISILEINEAGSLNPVLKTLGRHVLGAYPDVDIHALPYEKCAFDLVVHSDTLEHVENPVHALEECRRVLKPTGALCFTVPTIVGRMSRSRDGLPKSFHGNASTAATDWAVQTEFGADGWTYLFLAGFNAVTIHSVEYPAAIAFMAKVQA